MGVPGLPGPPDPAQRAAAGRRDDARLRRAEAVGDRDGVLRGLGPGHGHRRAQARREGCGWSSWSPTAGRPSGPSRRCATRWRPRWPRPGTPAGTGCWPSSSSTWTTSGPAPTCDVDGDPEIQQAVRFGAVPDPAGRRAGRGPGHPGQGPDRARLRRPRVLGHRELRAAGADLHAAARRPRTRSAGGTRSCPRPCERAKQLGLKGAAFPWRTIAGEECSAYWPAGTAAFHVNADIADAVARFQLVDRDAGLRPAVRASRLLVETARLWASLGLLRRQRRVPDRRRDRAGRVQRHRRQQRLHQPDGQAEPARGGRRAAGPGRRPGRTGPTWTTTSCETWQRAADHMRLPYDERLGVHPQADDFTSHAGLGLRRHHAGPVPAAAALPVLRPVPQAGGQAGRPGHGAVPGEPRVHRRAEAARLRVLRAADRPRLLAVGLRPGHHRGRDRAPGPGLRLLGRGRPDGPRRPGAQHRRRPAHRVAGRGLAGGRVRASAGCATRWTACRRSRPGCPAR